LADRDVLIFGTSHAEQGFVPNVLEVETGWTWMNLGKARRTLAFNAAWSKRLVASGVRPKKVVLVTTYHDWNERSHPYLIYPMVPSSERFSIWWDHVSARELTHPRTWFNCDQYSPTIRMMVSRCLSYAKNRRPSLRWQTRGDHGYVERFGELAEQVEPETWSTYGFNVKPANASGFNDFLDTWAKVGVEVVVVDPPEFMGSRLSHRDYDLAWTRVETETQKRGLRAKSFSDPNDAFLLNHAHFIDGGWGYPNSHLSHRGAVAFSKRFAEWLKMRARGEFH
jgi:hypothetical protein